MIGTTANTKAGSDAGNTDVIIIGGGIIGLLTAYELMQAGASVTLIDRQPIARESSWAGGGILSPLYPWRYPEAVTALASWSQQNYPQLNEALIDATGIDPEYQKSGLLIYSPNENESAVKWAEKHKNCLELASPEQAAELQPGIAVEESEWIWMPEVAQVRNPRLLQALRVYLSEKGAKIVENDSISGFLVDSGRLKGVQAASGILNANKVLVAAGAWSGQLLANLGVEIEVEPVRGQILLLRGQPGMLGHMVLRDRHYLIPRKDGRILVGSTLEYEGFDKSTTNSAREELITAAEGIFPGILDRCEIELQWAGLRPGSPEGIPYIGPYPEVDGLFVSTGHFRNGFVLAPASARLAADLLLDRPALLEAGDYRLRR